MEVLDCFTDDGHDFVGRAVSMGENQLLQAFVSEHRAGGISDFDAAVSAENE